MSIRNKLTTWSGWPDLNRRPLRPEVRSSLPSGLGINLSRIRRAARRSAQTGMSNLNSRCSSITPAQALRVSEHPRGAVGRRSRIVHEDRTMLLRARTEVARLYDIKVYPPHATTECCAFDTRNPDDGAERRLQRGVRRLRAVPSHPSLCTSSAMQGVPCRER